MENLLPRIHRYPGGPEGGDDSNQIKGPKVDRMGDGDYGQADPRVTAGNHAIGTMGARGGSGPKKRPAEKSNN